MATQSLTLDMAKTIALAAEREAAKNGWAVTVAILDQGGLPVCLHRMDGAAIAPFPLAGWYAMLPLKLAVAGVTNFRQMGNPIAAIRRRLS